MLKKLYTRYINPYVSISHIFPYLYPLFIFYYFNPSFKIKDLALSSTKTKALSQIQEEET